MYILRMQFKYVRMCARKHTACGANLNELYPSALHVTLSKRQPTRDLPFLYGEGSTTHVIDELFPLHIIKINFTVRDQLLQQSVAESSKTPSYQRSLRQYVIYAPFSVYMPFSLARCEGVERAIGIDQVWSSGRTVPQSSVFHAISSRHAYLSAGSSILGHPNNQLRCGGHRGLALGRYSYRVSQPRRWRPDKPLDAAQEHWRKAKIAGYCDHHPE
ncbi:conserved hypothetical protein [Coccidioides posadasii str. Silveira]|uniref:Uncharacterized protein n=2 Tax=Coccidioides posadasii TaxID=199306 RepID=E9CZL1_COCPS|nr:conserved hypothetical protein [Coccidioides posadasii str. Silveira]KMM73319.1 hypothetical protein CPAG_09608 [Coccidioides posadasii RMSCC 3488]